MHLWELFEEYELFARSTNRSPHTITSMKYHVRRFSLFLNRHNYSHDCEQVTPRTIRAFIINIQGSYAAKTVTNNVVALKTLFAFGLREELIVVDPTTRIKAPKLPVKDFEIFENEDWS